MRKITVERQRQHSSHPLTDTHAHFPTLLILLSFPSFYFSLSLSLSLSLSIYLFFPKTKPNQTKPKTPSHSLPLSLRLSLFSSLSRASFLFHPPRHFFSLTFQSFFIRSRVSFKESEEGNFECGFMLILQFPYVADK
ncbi:hypothetical protein RIF29_05076 [Crotalaria pallida]|uniref:Transmembrane protein n=1 Tax=Crotalaria pallida TaxID=3830 RepID=A0AAN9J1M1_CROPI